MREKKASTEIRKEFAGDFWVDFLGPFRWKKQEEKIHPKSTAKLKSESVKCRFSKCRFSVLNLKFDSISDGGCTREKQIQKALGSLPPCGNRCRFSESAICSSRVHPPSEIKSDFKFKTLRWRPLRWRLTLSDQIKIWELCGQIHTARIWPWHVAFLFFSFFYGCNFFCFHWRATTSAREWVKFSAQWLFRSKRRIQTGPGPFLNLVILATTF